MKQLVIALFFLLSFSACAPGGSTSEKSVEADSIATESVDTVYNAVVTDSLLAKTVPTQADYAAMIEQCRAINRKLTDKLAAINFKSDMTDAEIDAAMKMLQGDEEIPRLEEQSRKLLVVLQNADLDLSNRNRYDRMVSDAAAALMRLN